MRVLLQRAPPLLLLPLLLAAAVLGAGFGGSAEVTRVPDQRAPPVDAAAAATEDWAPDCEPALALGVERAVPVHSAPVLPLLPPLDASAAVLEAGGGAAAVLAVPVHRAPLALSCAAEGAADGVVRAVPVHSAAVVEPLPGR